MIRCQYEECGMWTFAPAVECFAHLKVRDGLLVLDEWRPRPDIQPDRGPERAPLGTEVFEVAELRRAVEEHAAVAAMAANLHIPRVVARKAVARGRLRRLGELIGR